MTPVSFAKTTETFEVSLVTINRQTSFDFGILRQDYRIIQGLLMNHTRFAHRGTISVITFTGTDRSASGRLCEQCIAAITVNRYFYVTIDISRNYEGCSNMNATGLIFMSAE